MWTTSPPVKDGLTTTDKRGARPAEAHHAGRAFLSSQWRLSSLYRALCSSEAALGVAAVAERLGRRAAAAAERDRAVLLVRLEVELVAVGVDQRDRSAHAVGPVLADLDLDAVAICHDRDGGYRLRFSQPFSLSRLSAFTVSMPGPQTIVSRLPFLAFTVSLPAP